MSSSELKQLFHSPEDMSDAELDILRVKLQNMNRVPKLAAGFGLVAAAFTEGVLLRRKPTLLNMTIGTVAGYAFGGYGASAISSNMLSRDFDYDIIIANEKRQLRKTMNLAGYGNEHVEGDQTSNMNKSFDRPY